MTGRDTSQMALVVLVVGGAVVLWFGLLGRVAQILILYWKVGDGRITGGSLAAMLFVLAACGVGALGILTATVARRAVLKRISKVAGVASLVAGAAWLALLASPLVQFSPR